jgi:hypothetical protein
MMEKPEDDKFKKRIELFECYYNDPDQHHKIFSEPGFSYMVDDCDGNCPECNFDNISIKLASYPIRNLGSSGSYLDRVS